MSESTNQEELSGRDLNFAVAERVMGRKKMVATDPVFEGQEGWSTNDVGGFTPFIYWRPSESISDAMEALAKFPIWNINKTDHPDFADRPYSVTVSVHEHEHSSRINHFEVQAETVEIGICRAALKALDHTQESR